MKRENKREKGKWRETKNIITWGSKMKDRKGEVVEDDWERDREILRKMITGKIKLLVIGRKGELEREIGKYQEQKERDRDEF